MSKVCYTSMLMFDPLTYYLLLFPRFPFSFKEINFRSCFNTLLKVSERSVDINFCATRVSSQCSVLGVQLYFVNFSQLLILDLSEIPRSLFFYSPWIKLFSSVIRCFINSFNDWSQLLKIFFSSQSASGSCY